MSRHQNIRVIKNAVEPETPEILAASLIAIAEAFEGLNKAGGITDKGLVALIGSMPGMSKIPTSDIALVLENIAKLKSYYVRAAPTKK